jgi:hypothetical protein
MLVFLSFTCVHLIVILSSSYFPTVLLQPSKALTFSHLTDFALQPTQAFTIPSDGSISATFLFTPNFIPLYSPTSGICQAVSLPQDAEPTSCGKQSHLISHNIPR